MKLPFKKTTQTLFLSTSLLVMTSTLGMGQNEPVPAPTVKAPPAKEKGKTITKTRQPSKTPPYAKTDYPQPASPGEILGGALTSAYQNNTQIQEQRAKLRAADEGIPRALAGYKPTLNADAGLRWQKDIEGGNQLRGTVDQPGVHSRGLKSADAGLVLNQNIYRGGADKAAVDGAESSVKAERARLLATEQDVLYQAAKAYLDLYAKMAQLNLLRTNEDVLRKTLESTQDKFKVGEETRTSVAQNEANLADGIAKRQMAEGELEAIKATYERVTGLKPGKVNKPRELEILPKDLTEALKKARDNNPQIRAAIYEGDAARHDIDRVHAGLRPTLDFTGGLRRTLSKSWNRYNPATDGGIARQDYSTRDTQEMVELRAKMPIYEAGAIRSQVRQARETSEQKRVAIETARREVVEKLTAAWQNYLAAKANVMSYSAQVKAFEVSVEGTRQEMLVGNKILLDFLNEQKKLVEAQLNLVRAEQEYYISGYQVLAAIGALNAKSLGLNVRHYNPEVHYQEAKYNHF